MDTTRDMDSWDHSPLAWLFRAGMLVWAVCLLVLLTNLKAPPAAVLEYVIFFWPAAMGVALLSRRKE